MQVKKITSPILSVLYVVFTLFVLYSSFVGTAFFIFDFVGSVCIVCVPHWIHYFLGVVWARKNYQYATFIKVVNVIRIVGLIVLLVAHVLFLAFNASVFALLVCLSLLYLSATLFPQIVLTVKEKTFPFVKSWIITMILGLLFEASLAVVICAVW